jgi:hypothetical protein
MPADHHGAAAIDELRGPLGDRGANGNDLLNRLDLYGQPTDP